jgi:hypothetical protein
VSDPEPNAVEPAVQGALAYPVDDLWRSALAEYGPIAAADPDNMMAGIGVARALARGGYLDESYRVLSTVLKRSTLGEVERRHLLDAVRAEASPAEPHAKVDDVAAAAGLLVWRHSRCVSAYFVLMIVISVLPLTIGITQRHYASIAYGAVTGAALIYLYITRHRVPAWRS